MTRDDVTCSDFTWNGVVFRRGTYYTDNVQYAMFVGNKPGKNSSCWALTERSGGWVAEFRIEPDIINLQPFVCRRMHADPIAALEEVGWALRVTGYNLLSEMKKF